MLFLSLSLPLFLYIISILIIPPLLPHVYSSLLTLPYPILSYLTLPSITINTGTGGDGEDVRNSPHSQQQQQQQHY